MNHNTENTGYYLTKNHPRRVHFNEQLWDKTVFSRTGTIFCVFSYFFPVEGVLSLITTLALSGICSSLQWGYASNAAEGVRQGYALCWYCWVKEKVLNIKHNPQIIRHYCIRLNHKAIKTFFISRKNNIQKYSLSFFFFFYCLSREHLQMCF